MSQLDGAGGDGPPRSPRLTRRHMLLGGAAAAAAVGIGAAIERLDDASPDAAAVSVDFSQLSDRPGWSTSSVQWYARLPHRAFEVRGGRGRVGLPAALLTSAPDQPVPFFVVDSATTTGRQTLEFTVTTPAARPGLLCEATNDVTYLAVRVANGSLQLLRWTRTGCTVIAARPVPPLRAHTPYVLQLERTPNRLRGGLSDPGRTDEWTLEVPHTPRPGGHGVVVSGGSKTPRYEVSAARYTLAASERLGSQAPRATYLVAGPPRPGPGAPARVALRVGCERPAGVTIETCPERGFQSAVNALPPQTVQTFPLTARADVSVPAGDGLWWRARLRSLSSDAEWVSPPHRIRLPDLSRPLVMGATCCAQLWQEPIYHGLMRLLHEAAPVPPALVAYEGDFGYPSNGHDSCYVVEPDFYADRITRFLGDPAFVELRRHVPVAFTMDDHEYGPRNNADAATLYPWTIELWNAMYGDQDLLGYMDWRFGDVHSLTLDGRRYADPPTLPESPSKTKLGVVQKAWLRDILTHSDARMFVLFSADIFATRTLPDCWIQGWHTEFVELMTLFHSVQLRGKRVVILAGDAHGQRVHYHPDPAGRAGTEGRPVIEFICAGLRARTWSGPLPGDPTLDRSRFVLGKSGLGMIVVDPPGPRRKITMRSINGDQGPLDLFPPLVVPFSPRGRVV